MKEGKLGVSEQTSICHDHLFKMKSKCKVWQDCHQACIKLRIYELETPV